MPSTSAARALFSRVVPRWPEQLWPAPPYVLGVVPGEGIGPEVVGAALTVLEAVADRHDLQFETRIAGGLGAPGPYGSTLVDDMAEFVAATFASRGTVLCGPAGGRFVYELRGRFDLFCKLTPVRPMPALADVSIVRPERLRNVDVLLVRDNSAGLYQGDFGRRDGGRTAWQELAYRVDQVDDVLGVAARAAAARHGRMTLVLKNAGIPEVSALWRERTQVVAAEHDIALDELEVDNACFQLVADAGRFDVVVAPNMLGDVVADAAALTLGSRGMALSANFGHGSRAVYQTAHGGAHDLAGTDRANPVAQILSLALLLRESFGLAGAADTIDTAVGDVLGAGFRTPDVAGPASTVVGTFEMANLVAETVASSGG